MSQSLIKNLKRKNEPGTLQLLRTACKAFARLGDEKSGRYKKFKPYIQPFLKEHKMQTSPLQPYEGNRFNILFVNASYIYFLKDQLLEFLGNLDLTNSRLLNAVKKDLQTPYFIAGCKALGLISKFITTPLWKTLENEELNISEMS